MPIFITLLFIFTVLVDTIRLASSWTLAWYVPPFVLILAALFDKELSYRYVYIWLLVSGLVFDVFSQELFGTNGIVLCASLALANLSLRSLERSNRKTLYKTILASTLYVLVRAVVW